MPENTPKPLPTNSWIEVLYTENIHEEMDNMMEYIRLLPNEPRSFVWELANKIVGPEHKLDGVASLACQLFERYLAVFIRSFRPISPGSRQWIKSKLLLKGKAVMLVSVCIRLAFKSGSHLANITTTTIQQRLQEHNAYFSLKDINNAEEEVFKALNFRIPLWSNVEKARMLSVEVGLTGRPMETAGLVMDIVDFHKEQLQTEIIQTVCSTFSITEDRLNPDAQASSSSSSPTHYYRYIRNMHFIGGVVAATAQFLSLPTDPVSEVARLVNTNPKYIMCIRNVILLLLNKTCIPKHETPSTSDESDVFYGKRRRCC